jgi:hypothetical protein
LKFREDGSDDQKLQDVTSAVINAAYKTELEPEPISMAEQALRDKVEEEENKKREQEARAA